MQETKFVSCLLSKVVDVKKLIIYLRAIKSFVEGRKNHRVPRSEILPKNSFLSLKIVIFMFFLILCYSPLAEDPGHLN